MIDLGRHGVLGVGVSAVDYEAAVARIIDAARAGQPLAVSALAVHGVMSGYLDRTHRYRLNHLDLVVPDGHPVRWALRWLHGVGLADRVYGPNLMLYTCARAAEERLPIFLFGSTEAVLTRLAERLQKQFPELQIAGRLASRFRTLTAAERDVVVSEIRASGAAITFAGLGCPRQEVWAYELRDHLRMPILAVGAAFDFHAGLLPQAPAWLQDRGLEWAYRLAKEPRRLWRRYLLLNPLYLALVLAQWSGYRRFDAGTDKAPTSETLYG